MRARLRLKAGYAEMARRQHLAFKTPILFCFPTLRREQTARAALAATSASYQLQIATAAFDPRVTCPAGQVWMTLHGGHGPMRLIDLDDVLPDPWRADRARYEQDRREMLGQQHNIVPADEPDDPLGPYG